MIGLGYLNGGADDGGAYSKPTKRTPNTRPRARARHSPLFSAACIYHRFIRYGADGEKLYQGQAAYNKNLKDAQIGNAKNSGTQGPVRAPAFFRATCR